ncbi:hypothetical protein [Mycoplasma hafezii]|uniref:hypothetical protein n=1 Tax=Mycoplasma hafezii TaxID=525886 RepID=UPI003CE94B5A
MSNRDKIRIAFNQATGIKIFFNFILALMFLVYSILLLSAAVSLKPDRGLFASLGTICFLITFYFGSKFFCLIILKTIPFCLGKKFLILYSILEFKKY